MHIGSMEKTKFFISFLGMHNGSGEYKTPWNCKKFTDRWTDRGPTSDQISSLELMAQVS